MAGSPEESISEYNRDQLTSILSILHVLDQLSKEEIESLRARIQPYLAFRRDVSQFYESFFRPSCRKLCFETRMSACCGFESIITFFADHVVSLLESSRQQIEALISVISRPNLAQRCVYLGAAGCLWKIPPISCAMFLCPQVKDTIFEAHPKARDVYADHQQGEKRFTLPDKPVLFDELEAFFMRRGSESPHLFFHRSPGLLRIKSKAGMGNSARIPATTKVKQ